MDLIKLLAAVIVPLENLPPGNQFAVALNPLTLPSKITAVVITQVEVIAAGVRVVLIIINIRVAMRGLGVSAQIMQVGEAH